MKRKREVGFSLIELLVVIAIILIIAAIAIPRLLSARAAASESAAAGTMRSLGTALMAYDVKWGTFPASVASLGGTACSTTAPTATAGCNLDDVQAMSIGSGQPLNKYLYTYAQVNNGGSFTILADPAAGNNASRHFYLDDGLTLHYNDTTAARCDRSHARKVNPWPGRWETGGPLLSKEKDYENSKWTLFSDSFTGAVRVRGHGPGRGRRSQAIGDFVPRRCRDHDRLT